MESSCAIIAASGDAFVRRAWRTATAILALTANRTRAFVAVGQPPFERGCVLNAAVAHLDADGAACTTLCFVDADVTPLTARAIAPDPPLADDEIAHAGAVPYATYASGCICMTRALFHRARGFPPAWPPGWGGEDDAFVLRAMRAGLRRIRRAPRDAAHRRAAYLRRADARIPILLRREERGASQNARTCGSVTTLSA